MTELLLINSVRTVDGLIRAGTVHNDATEPDFVARVGEAGGVLVARTPALEGVIALAATARERGEEPWLLDGLVMGNSVQAGAVAPVAPHGVAASIWDDPLPASAKNVVPDFASSTAVVVLKEADGDLTQAGVDELDRYPRTLMFQTSGSTPGDAPANVSVEGVGPDGEPQSEVVALAQTATFTQSLKCFRGTGLILTYEPGDGTGALLAVSLGTSIALQTLPKVDSNANAIVPVAEFEDGAAMSIGTFQRPDQSPPFGSMTPSNGFQGINYALVYLIDP